LFHYQWQDRFRVSSILGAHLAFLSLFCLFLVVKALFISGLYDTCSAGGGDVRLLKSTTISLNPFLLSRYLFRAPFGGQGWIVSVNNPEINNALTTKNKQNNDKNAK
jgi:photosystem II CP43 chlorophyll apoprotein